MTDRDYEAQLMGFNSHEQYEAAMAAMTTGHDGEYIERLRTAVRHRLDDGMTIEDAVDAAWEEA